MFSNQLQFACENYLIYIFHSLHNLKLHSFQKPTFTISDISILKNYKEITGKIKMLSKC